MLFFEHLQEATRSLRSTRARTFLTVIGIAIGVASITTILSLHSGITNVISSQVASLDGNIAIIRPSSPSTLGTNTGITSPTNQQMFNTSLLTSSDVRTVADLEGVKDVAPIMVMTGSMKADKTVINDGLIVATSPGMAEISNLEIRDGQFIDTVTNPNTAGLACPTSQARCSAPPRR